MNEPLELSIKATTENVRRVMDSIESYLRRNGVHPPTILDVQLAADEALTNIVEHGYHQQEGTIQVR